jgi:diaminopimelate epimerase
MTKTINFCKMHGLGNDFIVINALSKSVRIDASWVQQQSNRRTGIGFDQLLLIQPSSMADVACRIFNADGSEAEQCGNGMRCVARFLHESKLISKNSLTIETLAGVISAVIHDYDKIQVNMGIPHLEQKNAVLHPAPLEKSLELSVLSIGNPHAILPVSSLQTCSFEELGPVIGSHSYFPNGTNVGFMEILNRQHIRLRTFERGVGETLACGSNASAAVVAGIWNGSLDHTVRVELELGSLWIEWAGEKNPVLMTGSASRVFDGICDI